MFRYLHTDPMPRVAKYIMARYEYQVAASAWESIGPFYV